MKYLWKSLVAYTRRVVKDRRGTADALINVTGVSDIDNAIPDKWAPGVFLDGTCKSFWKKFMGKEGSRMPIITSSQFAPKGAKTNNVIFNTMAQLYSRGVTGETVLKGSESKMKTGVFCIVPELYRNAVGITKKTTWQANFDEVQRAAELCKIWVNCEITFQIFESLLGVGSGQTNYANSRTSVDSLTTTDKFGCTELDLIWLALKRMGAQPLAVTVDNDGEEIPVFGCVIDSIDMYNLQAQPSWINGKREAYSGMAEKSPIFTRALGKYGGLLVYEFSGIAGADSRGSPLRPEAQVYGTLTTAASTITVGSDSTEELTRFFGSTGTLQIEDEFITYTGKTNITFTGCTRGVTVGSTGSTAIQHVDKAVTQRNISTVVGFGAEAAFFGWGEEPTAIGDNEDYKARIGIGIEGYWGIARKVDKRTGRAPNIALLKAYSGNPGTI